MTTTSPAAPAPAATDCVCGSGYVCDRHEMPRTAQRGTFYEARRAFRGGASVIVTERNEGSDILVYPRTTIHRHDTTSWEELAGQVRMWRNRYPHQTFYILP